MIDEPECANKNDYSVDYWYPLWHSCKKCVNTWIDRAVLECVFAYNRAKIHTQIHIRLLRKTNIIIDSICFIFDTIARLISNAIKLVFYKRVEPNCESWISLYSYNPADNSTNESRYTFDNCLLTEWPSTDFQELFQIEYANIINASNRECDRLIVGQICPEMVVIKRAANADANKDLLAVRRTNISFLSIDYIFDNHNSITIDIPKSHNVIGNELLSRSYLIRYFEHLPIYSCWFFDGKYSLRIIDSNLNTLSLNETQWVLLTEDGYVVRSSDTEPNKVVEEEETKESETLLNAMRDDISGSDECKESGILQAKRMRTNVGVSNENERSLSADLKPKIE